MMVNNHKNIDNAKPKILQERKRVRSFNWNLRRLISKWKVTTKDEKFNLFSHLNSPPSIFDENFFNISNGLL
jgi:hypothetical protein